MRRSGANSSSIHFGTGLHVDQTSAEVSTASTGSTTPVENSITALWECAKRASELITQLRSEKRALQARADQLERELRQLRAELSRIEQVMKNAPDPAEGRHGLLFTNGDRDAMMSRVKELLAKLDAYL